MAIYFFLSALESLAVCFYFASQVSAEKSRLFLNLSSSRLLISALLLAAAMAFLAMGILAMRRNAKGKAWLPQVLGSRKALLTLFCANIPVIGLMYFLLTRPPSFGGDWKLVFQQMEPIFVWVLLLSAQACFFIAVWVCAYFIIYKEEKSIEATKKELLPVFGIFFAALLLKWLIVSASIYGPGVGDEMVYYDIAESMNRGFFSFAQSHRYPPIYPLILMPALIFGQHAYTLIKLINAVLSTSIVFPVYFLSRGLLDSKKSLLVALIACVIPYHLVFPRRILSENPYFPLFLWEMLLILKRPEGKKTSLAWDIFSGIGLGLLYLTRYISLAIIPMFLIAWWAKPFDAEDRLFRLHWNKVRRGLMIFALGAIVFSPWILSAIREGQSVKTALGFFITANADPSQTTFLYLLIWIVLYISYIILMVAPILPLLIKALTSVNFKEWRNSEFSRLFFQTAIVLAGLLTASVRHSWRVAYNEILPTNMMGRYMLYAFIPFLILAFYALELHNRNAESRNTKTDLWILLASAAASFAAYYILIEGKLIRVGNYFLRLESSVEGYYVKILGFVFLILIGVIYLLYFAYFTNQKNRIFFRLIPVALVVFFTCGWFNYYQALKANQTFSWLSRQISIQAWENIPEDELSKGISLFVPAELDDKPRVEIYNGLRVRGIDNTRITDISADPKSSMETEAGFIIREYSDQELPGDSGARLNHFNGKAFTLELITK
jgi:hypothetical protein